MNWQRHLAAVAIGLSPCVFLAAMYWVLERIPEWVWNGMLFIVLGAAVIAVAWHVGMYWLLLIAPQWAYKNERARNHESA